VVCARATDCTSSSTKRHPPMAGWRGVAKARFGLGSRTPTPWCRYLTTGLACRVITLVSHFAQCSGPHCSQKGRSDRERWGRRMRLLALVRQGTMPSFPISPPASACVLLASPWLVTCRGLSATSHLGVAVRFGSGPLEELGN
jgi:hypothetical protein